MKAGSVANQCMDALAIARCKVLKIKPVTFLTHSGHLTEISLTPCDLLGPIEMVPLVFGLRRNDRPHTTQTPEFSVHGMQSEASLVHHPDFCFAALWQSQSLKLIAQLFAE